MESLVKAFAEMGLVWPDTVSAQASLGRRAEPGELRAWRELLNQAYGRRVLRAGWAIFGRQLTLKHAEVLAKNIGAWEVAIEKSRSLAPLLATFVRLERPHLSDVGAIRADLLVRGLKPAAWKWLCHQHPLVVRKLLCFGWTPECLFWLNVLSQAHQGRTLHSSWLEEGRPFDSSALYERAQANVGKGRTAKYTLELERLFKLLPSQATHQALAEYSAIVNAYLLGCRDSRWKLGIQVNSTWKGLLEKIRRFEVNRLNAAQAAQAARLAEDPQHLIAWSPHFETFKAGTVQVVELLSHTDLVSEGIALSHCVGDGAYLGGCLSGEHIIASMQESLSRTRATLQLRKSSSLDKWVIAQLAGVGNARVPEVFWRAAHALRDALPT